MSGALLTQRLVKRLGEDLIVLEGAGPEALTTCDSAALVDAVLPASPVYDAVTL